MVRFRSKLSLCVGAVVLVPVLAAVLFLPADQVRRFRRWLLDADQTSTAMLAETAGPAIELFDVDPSHLASTIASARRHPDLIYVRVFAADGRELPGTGASRDNSSSSTRQRHATGSEIVDDVLHVQTVARAGGRDVGWIRAGFTTASIRRSMDIYRKTIIALGALVMVTAMSAAFGLGTMLARPMERLGLVMGAISRGGAEEVPPLAGSSEVVELRTRFIEMLAALRETTVSREHVANIIQSMGEMVVVTDVNGSITSINNAVTTVLGYGEDDLMDLPASVLWRDDAEGGGESNSWLTELQACGRVQQVERWVQHSEGYRIPVLFSAAALRDRGGTLEGIVCVAQDISARKRHEEDLRRLTEELRRSNRELEEFAYVASHDLQEPLRKVIAFGERLRKQYGEMLDERGLDYLRRMESATARMRTLIIDLLAYSRVDSKGQQFVKVDLDQVVRDVVTDLEIRILESGGRVDTGPLPCIEADPLQMRQLFQNLLGNALKFRRPDEAPVVHISCAKSASVRGAVVITVSDNGIGFEQEYSERIFGVFQRLHGRGVYEGTGMGLAICRKIAKRHGGSIVASGVVGRGAIFSITLPVTHGGGS